MDVIHSLRLLLAINNLKEWMITYCGVKFLMNHKNKLTSQLAWLDDQLINAAQAMLKTATSTKLMKGLQPSVLADNFAMLPAAPNGDFVQVIQVNNDYWFALSTVGHLKSVCSAAWEDDFHRDESSWLPTYCRGSKKD